MSGSVSQTFGDFFGRFFGMLDRWEFWGRVLLIVIALAIFNGVTSFIRERILAGMENQDENSYSRADGQARIWAVVLIVGGGFIAAMIADAMEGVY